MEIAAWHDPYLQGFTQLHLTGEHGLQPAELHLQHTMKSRMGCACVHGEVECVRAEILLMQAA